MKAETEIEPRKKDGARGRTPSGARTRALVIEDEPAMPSLLKEALGAADIEAFTLVNSAEADTRFQKEKFDVILVDASTSSENGSKLVQKIRSSGFNLKTPVIMISEDQRPDAVSKAFEAGASFFVYKPIDKAHLMRLIRVTQGTIEHEKRRFRRIAVQTKVQVKSGDKIAEGETIDVSLNGTLVRASSTFPPGSTVEVSLHLQPGLKPVVGIGSVMRVMAGNQMGIQLENLPASESGRLQEYLLPLITE
jgi:two-component system chemotaxis response regulator CheY